MRKIGYFVPKFPGQTHIFFWREINEIRKKSCEVKLISTRKPNVEIMSHKWSSDAMHQTRYLIPLKVHNFYDLFNALSRIRANELKVLTQVFLKEAEPGTRWSLFGLLPFALLLSEYCRKNGVGHVHVHSCANAAAIVALASTLGGVKYSLVLHGPLSDYGSNQKLKWAHAEFAFVISKKLLSEVNSNPNTFIQKNVYVVSMGVDIEYFQRKKEYELWSEGAPLYLFSCGRLSRVKGHQEAIEAVRILNENYGIDVRLTIAGEAEAGKLGYRKQLEAQIANSNLECKVKLLGAVSEEEVRKKLESCHLFVLASHHEPLGVAYMEAMSMSVPVVGSKSGGVDEIIIDGVDGILVSPQEPNELASQIYSLVNTPDKIESLRQNARKKAVREFSASKSSRMLINLLGGKL